MKTLIINADDFGLHELVNEGIIESHAAGCITSASLMAGGEAFEHAVALARQHPRLGVGVHLSLVGGRPVARGNIHTLLDNDGMLPANYQSFIQKYLCGQIDKKHIEYELTCQMQKVAGKGIAITHVDSHQHLHVLPGIPEIVSKVARNFHIRKVRFPGESLCFFGAGPFRAGRVLSRSLLTICARLTRKYYTQEGFCSPRHFFGMLAGGSMTEAALLHILRKLPDGLSEIMVHPGRDTTRLRRYFPWSYHWQEETAALTSPEVLAMIREQGIQLTHYGELASV